MSIVEFRSDDAGMSMTLHVLEMQALLLAQADEDVVGRDAKRLAIAIEQTIGRSDATRGQVLGALIACLSERLDQEIKALDTRKEVEP